jgi:class 3 adenylate cyclase
MDSNTSLPSGTVTFLLTDVEESTRLWDCHPEAMQVALARHDAIAETVFHQHGGALIKARGEGDSLFAVFARAGDAAAAALALQQALNLEPWPTGVTIRCRVAIHTGACDPRAGDYYGAAVNQCARLRTTARGGQVLLSSATREVAGDDLPPEASLRDLGMLRLRGVRRPTHVYQLVHSCLSNEIPMPRCPASRRRRALKALLATALALASVALVIDRRHC